MRLVMTLLVRDEVDVVRQNIEFHLDRGVDLIIVTDNRSVDGTRDVLEELAAGGSVRVIDEPDDDFSQYRWVSRMAALARDEHGADWIINSDADEFWHAPGGDLKADVARIGSAADVIICGRRNMVAAYDRRAIQPWHQDLIYRVRTPIAVPKLRDPLTDPLPARYLYLDLPPKMICRAAGLVEVQQGNHSAVYASTVREATGATTVYHFPVRSDAQFVSKISNGGAAYARNVTVPQGFGWHWRRWHRMLVSGDSRTAICEALPSRRQLAEDLERGVLVVDRTIADELSTSVARLAGP